MKMEQLIEVLAGAYGLGDAPAHWRKTLKRALRQLEMVQSEFDPCIFKCFEKKAGGGKSLIGLTTVEVDDLLLMGEPAFFKKIDQLRERFVFGKFTYLDEAENGVSFNGRRLRSDKRGGFLIDMKKYVTERLEPVKLEVGRKSQPKEAANKDEKDATRAAVGALAWAAKEGRPDCAAIASLVASSMRQLTVEDIIDLNKCIDKVKANSELAIRIQHIPEEDLCWGVVTDASYANVKDGKSQGGYCVISYESKVANGEKGKCNLIHWRSGKIHRVVNSTLAAETQSLSKGLGEMMWTVTLYQELVDHNFNLKQWEQKLQEKRLKVFGNPESEELRNVAVVDAKSIYDHLSKEMAGYAADRRTALEMQVIKQGLCESGTRVAWVPHSVMIADILTKRGGNMQPLEEMIHSGMWKTREAKRK